MRDRKATVACLTAALILIIVGVCKNQQMDVLAKAINICLECVGIG